MIRLESKSLLLYFPLFLCFFLIPFDSFPIFPLDSIYRPVSIFPLAIIVIYTVCYTRFSYRSIFILLVCLFLIFHSLFFTLVYDYPLDHIKKSIFTLCILAVLLFALENSFNLISRHDLVKIISKASFYSLTITFIFCFIQFLPVLTGYGRDISEAITSLVSYRSVGRIQGVSGEPSQLFRNVLLLGIFSIILNASYKRYFSFFMTSFILIISGSTYGYLTLLLFIGGYLLFFESRKVFSLKFIFLFVFSFSLFSLFYTQFVDGYTKDKMDKVFFVLSEPAALQEVFEEDGSIFQRVVNPYIGFTSTGFENIFGKGLDTYRYTYPSEIMERFPFAYDFDMVYKAVSGESYITPKSLYSKVYFEFGWLSFILFASLYVYFYIGIKSNPSLDNSILIKSAFCLLVVYPINTDSIIYVNFWILVLFIYHSIRIKKPLL